MLNTVKILIKKILNLVLVIVSEYQKHFAKGYTQNWSEEVLIITKMKDTVLWTYAISDLNVEPIAGSFYLKRIAKT